MGKGQGEEDMEAEGGETVRCVSIFVVIDKILEKRTMISSPR